MMEYLVPLFFLAFGFGLLLLFFKISEKTRQVNWVFAGLVCLLASVAFAAESAGKVSRAKLEAACAKHGLLGYSRFGRDACVDEKGHIYYFADIK